MNTKGTIAAIMLLVVTCAVAQVVYQTPLRITGGFNRAGSVKWTNEIHTTRPVYQMLRASTVTGAWTHFLFITNQHATTLTNALGLSPGGIFHKLAWIADTQTVFNYVFEETPGIPAVIGQLNLTFVPGPNLGVWFCAEVGSPMNHDHPTGNGSFVGGGITVTPTNHSVRLVFTPLAGDRGVYLEGVMQQGTAGGKSIYTGFSGKVFENRFVGPTVIGTFTATRP